MWRLQQLVQFGGDQEVQFELIGELEKLHTQPNHSWADSLLGFRVFGHWSGMSMTL